jgi:hypothetical protein
MSVDIGSLVSLAEKYGALGVAGLLLFFIVRLLIDRGYRIKLDVGPESKR